MASCSKHFGYGRGACVVAALLLGVPVMPAAAQERPDAEVDHLEVTMRLLPEGATGPDPVTRVIELPEALDAEIADDATQRAEGAPETTRSAGRQTVDAVRGPAAGFMPAQNSAASVREAAAEDARDAAESARHASREAVSDAAVRAREAARAVAEAARHDARDVERSAGERPDPGGGP